MELQRTEKMNYDPKGIMVARKKAVRIQAFKHEIGGVAERENAEVFSLEQPSVCVVEQSDEMLDHSKINTANPSSIPTPTSNENGINRNHEKVDGMDVESHFSSKRSKNVSTGKDIVGMDLEESDNKTKKGGKERCLIQEEMSQQNESCGATSSEKIVS